MSRKEEHIERQHHVDMVKGDVATTVLVPSDPERVEVFAGLMDKANKVARKREYLTYTGEKDGVAISCTSSGIGPSPMAIGTEELVRLGAENIIRIGTCVTIDPAIKPGEMIIPLGAMRDERACEEFISIDYPAVADYRIVRALIDACEKLKIPYHMGIVRTHDAFYVDSPYKEDGFKDKVQKWLDMDIIAFDTETATMLVVSGMQGVRAGAVLLSGYPAPVNDDPEFLKHEKNLVMVGIEAAKNLAKMGLN
jgi:uridine phosphorylase